VYVWEYGVDELVEGDSEVGEYVCVFEEVKDISELFEVIGEVIVLEFECYLCCCDEDFL